MLTKRCPTLGSRSLRRNVEMIAFPPFDNLHKAPRFITRLCVVNIIYLNDRSCDAHTLLSKLRLAHLMFSPNSSPLAECRLKHPRSRQNSARLVRPAATCKSLDCSCCFKLQVTQFRKGTIKHGPVKKLAD